jgi:hypothetical protein
LTLEPPHGPVETFVIESRRKADGVHQTLRVTPAMEAGIPDHVWSIEEILGLLT